jgi:hypothetical protein
MIAVIVVVVIIVVAALLGAGAADNSGAPSAGGPTDNCFVCRKLESWWNSLPWYRQAYSWAWYLINHIACVAKGC